MRKRNFLFLFFFFVYHSTYSICPAPGTQLWWIVKEIACQQDECCSKLDVCCSTIESQLNIIESKIENINIDVTISGFDILESKLAECCSTLESQLDVIESKIDNLSFTDCCSELESHLDIIESKIDVDISIDIAISSKLDRCCSILDSQLDVIESKIDDCCSELESHLDVIESKIDECCESFCTKISQTDVGTFGYVISTPGCYILTENINFASSGAMAGAITINSSQVLLDLNGFTITQTNATGGISGVRINSGFSDIVVKNGNINNFTRSGLIVSNIGSRIKISDLSIFGCAIAGLEFSGVSSGTINESIIKNIQIIGCCTAAASGNTGILLTNCADMQFIDCTLNQNGVTTQNLSVIQLTGCFKCFMKNIIINDNVGNTDLRCLDLLSSTTLCIFSSCLMQDNLASSASSTFRGVAMTSGSNSDNNEFYDCIVMANAGGAAVDAFLTTTGCDNNLFVRCEASLNRSFGTGADAIVTGFNFINNSRNECIDCLARFNTATGSTLVSPSFGATGFNFNTATNNLLVRCIATENTAGSGTSSVGINVTDGTSNGVRECQSRGHSIGCRISPTNSTAVAIFSKNLADRNTTQYVGFVVGSNQIAASFAAINGSLTSPWTNAGVD